MLDINLIREQPDVVRKALADRMMDASPVDAILQLDEKRRALLGQVEALKAERNKVSKEIGQMKDASARGAKIEAMRAVGDQIAELDQQVEGVESELNTLTSTLPNIPDPHTPIGKDDSENVVIKTVGEPRKFDFTPLPHWDLGPALGIIDFERGTKLTGSRFYVLQGARFDRVDAGSAHSAGLRGKVSAVHGADRRRVRRGSTAEVFGQPLQRPRRGFVLRPDGGDSVDRLAHGRDPR
jgi:seryl-tRNA synthetase